MFGAWGFPRVFPTIQYPKKFKFKYVGPTFLEDENEERGIMYLSKKLNILFGNDVAQIIKKMSQKEKRTSINQVLKNFNVTGRDTVTIDMGKRYEEFVEQGRNAHSILKNDYEGLRDSFVYNHETVVEVCFDTVDIDSQILVEIIEHRRKEKIRKEEAENKIRLSIKQREERLEDLSRKRQKIIYKNKLPFVKRKIVLIKQPNIIKRLQRYNPCSRK